MKLKTALFIFTLLTTIFFNASCFAKDKIHFTDVNEIISVKEDGKGFQSDCSYKGFTESESSGFKIFYDELESIDKVIVRYENVKGKLVKLGSDFIANSSEINNEFYTGEKAYNFQLPKTNYFEYTYKKSSGDLMLLSNLLFIREEEADTISFDVIVPINQVLIYQPFEIDSTIKLTIDSVINRGNTEYHFFAVNHSKVPKDYLPKNFYLRNEQKIPSLKIIVVPAKYKAQPDFVFNQWYANLINTLSPLDSSSMDEVKEFIGNTVIPDSVAKKIFCFVQSKIKYIDIENGIHAFKPHDANMTCLNKQGDCKDMAFLLYRLLTHFGFDAHLALSATLDHYSDMDFPSNYCANHAICVLKKENKWIYLDATEKQCEYGLPSRQIQGKHIFIIDSNQGEFQYVPPVSADENKSFFNMELQVNGKKIDGSYAYDFRHVSSVFYRTFSDQLKKSDFDLRLKSILDNLTPSVDYTAINTSSTDSSFTIKGNLSLAEGLVTSYSNQHYLPLSFMPFLDLLPKGMSHKEKMITYSTLNKISEINIYFSDFVSLSNPRDEAYSENGFTFIFSVKKIGPKEIQICSKVIYDDVVIENAKVDSYNKFIAEIKSQLNKGIIYE